MKIWVDAQLSPALARWLGEELRIEAMALKDLGLRDGADAEIFFAARGVGAIVLTKDRDFVDLVRMHGAPPQVIGSRAATPRTRTSRGSWSTRGRRRSN